LDGQIFEKFPQRFEAPLPAVNARFGVGRGVDRKREGALTFRCDPLSTLARRAFPAFSRFPVNKAAVRDQILRQLRAEHELQLRAAQVSRDEAIDEESRPENKYDMHSQEAAYLAEGQARLAAEIAANIALYASLPLPEFPPGAPSALGALVSVENAGKSTWYFLGPRAGGLELEAEGRTVLVVTPQSPLGRELLGKRTGDAVRLPGSRHPQTARISAVS
jgi:transcription elongation GreA/GreB family factor